MLRLLTLLLLATTSMAGEVERERVHALLAGLSDPRPAVHGPALVGLASLGRQILPDLTQLARDRDAGIRMRVAKVAGEVGSPEGLELLLPLAEDRDPQVRAVTALSLGKVRLAQAQPALQGLMRDSRPGVREAAALGLGLAGDPQAIIILAGHHQGGPQPERMVIPKDVLRETALAPLRAAMESALRSLVASPLSVPAIQKALASLQGQELGNLLKATWAVNDPRLCPELVEVLSSTTGVNACLAAHSLAANGDGRCLELLCRLAAHATESTLSQAAAATLRNLTGHPAAAGEAWTLWWQDHQARVRSLYERDALIASLHDPHHQPTRTEMQRFPVDHLQPLVDGALAPAGSWAALAWRALQADDPSRWTSLLTTRYREATDDPRRVGLALLLHGLGDPAARPFLAESLAALERLPSTPGRAGHPQGSLRIALQRLLEH